MRTRRNRKGGEGTNGFFSSFSNLVNQATAKAKEIAPSVNTQMTNLTNQATAKTNELSPGFSNSLSAWADKARATVSQKRETANTTVPFDPIPEIVDSSFLLNQGNKLCPGYDSYVSAYGKDLSSDENLQKGKKLIDQMKQDYTDAAFINGLTLSNSQSRGFFQNVTTLKRTCSDNCKERNKKIRASLKRLLYISTQSDILGTLGVADRLSTTGTFTATYANNTASNTGNAVNSGLNRFTSMFTSKKPDDSAVEMQTRSGGTRRRRR
jgi:hypothetical protein